MEHWAEGVHALALETSFSGVIRVDNGDDVVFTRAYGLADRRHQVVNTDATQFGIASGVKSLTALAVASLIDDGILALTTTARSLLGSDLPLIDDAVTVEQLLSHRSGIGDYLDEDAGFDVTDYVMPRPVHELLATEDYLPILDGRAAKSAPGERFAYCNSGFVVLALLAERASGMPFHELVHEAVCGPAGMTDTDFLRADELPARAALGYLPIEGKSRTNVFHLPIVGSGDGGIFSTVADIRSFWMALFAGRIVSMARVVEMVTPRSDVPAESRRYGLGFWLHGTTDAVMLEGYDAGVSFHSVHDATTATTATVISNTSTGAWPIMGLLAEIR